MITIGTDSTYYVKDGETLGYVKAQQPGWFWPLAGAECSKHMGTLDTYVLATPADFDRFRAHAPPGLFETVAA